MEGIRLSGTVAARRSSIATTGRGTLPAAVLLAAAFLVTGARAEVLVLEPDRDNTLFQDAAGGVSDGSGPVFFAGTNSQGNVRRAVIYFDVASRLPVGAAIDSVMLTLNVSNAPNDTVRVVTIHRAIASWGEGMSNSSSGAGAGSTAGDATWIHRFYPDTTWQNPGGDFVAPPSAGASIGGVGPCSWSAPGLAADVQQWLSFPNTNFGWILIGEEGTTASARRFDSRENVNTAFRPHLTLYFNPGVPVVPTTWSAIKTRSGS